MKQIKKIVLIIAVAVGLLIVMGVPKSSYAFDIFGSACDNQLGDGDVNNNAKSSASPACKQAAKQEADNSNPVSGPTGAIQAATNIFALVTGVAALIIIVYSGFVFATTGTQRAGDTATRTRSARTMMVSALVGLAIAASAWIIVTVTNTWIIHK